MIPVELVVLQGATSTWEIRVVDGYGVPIDLSDVELRGQIRTIYDSPIIESTFDFTIIDGPNGAIQMGLNPVQTATLITRKYVYDVDAIEPSGSSPSSGSVYRILEGTITVRPRVTI